VRFGFSAGGLLFPFYVGVCRGLEEAGYLSANTKLAGALTQPLARSFVHEFIRSFIHSFVRSFVRSPGASAGSLIAACVNCGLSMDTVSNLCEDLMDDCRRHGTRGRLGILLEEFLQTALPEDAHIRCTGQTFVAVSSVESSPRKGLGMLGGLGNFGTPTGQLVSEFSDRDDLIEALMTSCHIPLWMDGRLTSSFRGSMHMDGGVTNFIPLPPDDGTPGVRVSCFGAKQMGLVYDIGIAPDVFEEWPHSLPTMVQWAYVFNASSRCCQCSYLPTLFRSLTHSLTHSPALFPDSTRPRNTFKRCWLTEGSRMLCLGRRSLKPRSSRRQAPNSGFIYLTL
jgi:hypothetical protein